MRGQPAEPRTKHGRSDVFRGQSRSLCDSRQTPSRCGSSRSRQCSNRVPGRPVRGCDRYDGHGIEGRGVPSTHVSSSRGQPRLHARSDLFPVVERKDEVGVSVPRQGPMRPRRTLDRPSRALRRGEHSPSARAAPRARAAANAILMGSRGCSPASILFRQHSQRQCLGARDGFRAALSVLHRSRDFDDFRNPPAVFFHFRLDREVHRSASWRLAGRALARLRLRPTRHVVPFLGARASCPLEHRGPAADCQFRPPAEAGE